MESLEIFRKKIDDEIEDIPVDKGFSAEEIDRRHLQCGALID